jgi:hypothetical protein
MTRTDELLAEQYVDRPALRPILDALLDIAARIGETAVHVRPAHVTFTGPRRPYALVRATTRDRLDLGLRLPGVGLARPLLPARGLGDGTINVRVALHEVADVDDDVEALLQRAYEANL